MRKIKKIISKVTLPLMCLLMLNIETVYAVGNQVSKSSKKSRGSGDIWFLFYLLYYFLPWVIGGIVILHFGIKTDKIKKDNPVSKFLVGATHKFIPHNVFNTVLFLDEKEVDSIVEGRELAAQASIGRDKTDEIVEKVQEHDSNFSGSNLTSKVTDIFVKVNTAWTKKDWSIVRPFEHQSLFDQHSEQLQKYIDKNTTPQIDNLSVDRVYMTEHKISGKEEQIKFIVTASHSYCVINDDTGKVVRGNPNNIKTVDYVLTMVRTKGSITADNGGQTDTSQCPNCFAPTQVTSAGQCKYCDTIITKGDFTWVMSNYELLENY